MGRKIMGRNTTSLRMDKEIQKIAKKYAIDRDLTFGELVETALLHEMQRR